MTPETKYRMCVRKKQYFSREEAEVGIRNILDRARDMAAYKPMHVYPCPICKFYHVGHNAKAAR